MSDIPAKPWSVAIFERERAHMTDFLKERVIPLLDAEECRRVVIRAPVKSGKREMAEYMAIRDHQAGGAQRVHAFLSAWHRTADEMQRAELAQHELRVFPVINANKARECVAWVREKLAAGKVVVLHLDECDYGSGDRQSLRIIYNEIRNAAKVFTILYSATPQEVLFSGEVADDEYQGIIDEMMETGEYVEYAPPAGYCGPGRFLDEGLVHEALPFFSATSRGVITLSAQGRQIMTDLRAGLAAGGRRNILVLRLSYSEETRGQGRGGRKENKAIYQFLHGINSVPELADTTVLVDKGDKDIGRHLPESVLPRSINWSKEREWSLLQSASPVIVVIDQTSSRSTEWACHNRVFAEHDYRNKVTYSVVSQAQERVNHYEGRYGGFQPIRVYGHRKTFLLSAGRIDYATYMRTEWEIRKVDRRRVEREGLGNNDYEVRSTAPDHPLHPHYPAPITQAAAEAALQELGCAAEIEVSPRVRGGVRSIPVYGVEFYACTKETFASILPRLRAHVERNFQNPFERSEREGLEGGRYKGYRREWGVWDYTRDVAANLCWGRHDAARLIICYRGDELGVAIRWDTGRRETRNTLEAFKSMYAQPALRR